MAADAFILRDATEADLPAKARAALERYEGREAPEALRKLVAKLG